MSPEAGLWAAGWLGFVHHRTTCSLGFASLLGPYSSFMVGPCLDRVFLEEPGKGLVA